MIIWSLERAKIDNRRLPYVMVFYSNKECVRGWNTTRPAFYRYDSIWGSFSPSDFPSDFGVMGDKKVKSYYKNT